MIIINSIVASTFVNSAGITLQGICDDEMKFTDCCAGYPSSVSDVKIFKNSVIYAEFINNPNVYFEENYFIIGDKAYPNKKYCISPYIDRGNLTRRQKRFNTAHAQTRQVIRTFTLLFGRFRRLKYLDMNRIDLIPATIIACCVLHNVLKSSR
ncbi:hypothetical protein RI129_002731 [Pyrocoelia pectoralis]|uniref:DDE Tnp4 domain-containing protein n=1 Tax=Pyrocoelia pectoralis TaxID=417401 RepID=A0AAN7VQ65_9COLE